MTLSTSIASQTFPGNGLTQIFPCAFRIFDETDVVVSLVDPTDGTSSVLTLNTDYTIAGAGDATGFTLSTTSPVADGKNLLVSRVMPYTQPTDFTNQGAFFPTMHEDAMDRLGMQIQQLAGASSRSLQLPDGLTPAPSGTLPVPSPLAPLAWNAAGTALENGDWSAGDVLLRPDLASTATGKGASLIGFVQSGTGAAARTSQDKLRESVSVKDFGAVGDGVADDTTAIQAAIDHANSLGGGRILFPDGTYISGKLTVYSNIYLVGQSRFSTVIKLKNGTNDDLIQGYDAPALHSSKPFSGGLTAWGLCRIQLDGNRANNTSGHVVNVFGAKPLIDDVLIKNAPQRGLWSDYTDSGQTFGMEGTFRSIVIDLCGEEGFYFEGPHDSQIFDVVVIDGSQKSANTYDNIYTDSNARWSQVHSWSRSTPAPRYALNVDSGGNDFSTSHFEGGVSACVRNNGSNNFASSCRYYSPKGGLVFLMLKACVLRGWVDYLVTGAPDSAGVQIGDASNAVSGAIIDVYSSTQKLGAISFINTGGDNRVIVRGYNAAGVAYSGSPNFSDEVNLMVQGPGGGSLVKDKLYVVAAAGTTTGTAAVLHQAAYNYVSPVASGAGVRIPDGPGGSSLRLSNFGANALLVYPPSGAAFGNGTTDAAVSLPVGKHAIAFQTAQYQCGLIISDY